jgi:hypothetical protein
MFVLVQREVFTMQVRRTLSTGGLLALLALALSGCIHATIGMNINSDGSGTYQFTTGLSKQITELGVSEDQIKQQFNQEGQQQTKQYGGTYRVFDDGSYINEEWDHSFQNITQLNRLIQESMQSNAATGGSSTSSVSNDSTVTVTQQGSDFHVTGTLDFTSAGSNTPPQVAALLQDAYLRVAITMPSIIAHNSDAMISGNTATITAKYGEKKTIDVTGGPSSALSGSSPLLWIIIALVALAAIGAGAYFYLRSRATQAVPVAAGVPPQPASGPFGVYQPTPPSGDYPLAGGVPSAPNAPFGGDAAPGGYPSSSQPYPGYQPPPAMPPDVPPDAPPTQGSEA